MVKRGLGVGFLLLAFGLFGTGPFLTGLVKQQLTRTLIAEARVAEGVDLTMAPLRLGDLMNGRVGAVDFAAARLGFAGGPVFTNVALRSKGGRFDVGALLWRGEFILRELAETHVRLELVEEELTALMRRDLPELEPTVSLKEGLVEVEGFLDLFGRRRLPFSASASLEKASGRSLRLAPLGLKVAGVALWSELFNQYAPQLSWEFPLEIPWPVRLERFKVALGAIHMEWREEDQR
ncbi:MAG: LmeA family phospholipid-binding protein [Firmicutes bacterium]|nr:LmeA family phospholipid-binding protein [Bacillota bacterium]